MPSRTSAGAASALQSHAGCSRAASRAVRPTASAARRQQPPGAQHPDQVGQQQRHLGGHARVVGPVAGIGHHAQGRHEGRAHHHQTVMPLKAAAAPMTQVRVKVRRPASARCGPLPLRRSRSMPTSIPQPSAQLSTVAARSRSGSRAEDMVAGGRCPGHNKPMQRSPDFTAPLFSPIRPLRCSSRAHLPAQRRVPSRGHARVRGGRRFPADPTPYTCARLLPLRAVA